MNFIENFKLTQWRKFSKIFSYICMQSFNIFGAIEGFLFKFTNLSGVWKFENYLTRPGPHVSARFRFTAQDGRPVPRVAPVPSVHAHRAKSAQRRWPLVVAAPRGLLPPPLPLLRTSPRKSSPTPLFPLSHSATLLAALLRASRCFTHHCPSAMSRPELSDQAKGSASSPRPSCTKSLPAASAHEAGPRDFPVVIFLREDLTDDSLLRLFPHPTHPAASSTSRRSSSLTSSSTASTTPSAPHQRLLPVGTRATAESPPPMSTPFPASPPRSRSSDCFPSVYSRHSPPCPLQPHPCVVTARRAHASCARIAWAGKRLEA
jgi:hypothetical protein